MASAIDLSLINPSKPRRGQADTASVRGNFWACRHLLGIAKAEIEAIQALLLSADSLELTGIPTAPTAALGTNTNQLATMAAVHAAIAALVGDAPVALDTLNEIAARLADDEDAVAALITATSKARAQVALTTGTTATGTTATGEVALGKSALLLAVSADRACRLRLYQTSAHRTADAGRLVGVAPVGDHGLIADVLFDGPESYWLQPPVMGANGDVAPIDSWYYSIINLGSNGPVSLTFNRVKLED